MITFNGAWAQNIGENETYIDTNIVTAQMLDAIYRSAEAHKEITL